MRIFILEDDTARMFRFMRELNGHEVTLCDSAMLAQEAWRPPYDLISLDHDLALQQMVGCAVENTGSGFCRWLAAFATPGGVNTHGKWFIHSFNPAGAASMQRILNDVGVYPDVVPFSQHLVRLITEALA